MARKKYIKIRNPEAFYRARVEKSHEYALRVIKVSNRIPKILEHKHGGELRASCREEAAYTLFEAIHRPEYCATPTPGERRELMLEAIELAEARERILIKDEGGQVILVSTQLSALQHAVDEIYKDADDHPHPTTELKNNIQ